MKKTMEFFCLKQDYISPQNHKTNLESKEWKSIKSITIFTVKLAKMEQKGIAIKSCFKEFSVLAGTVYYKRIVFFLAGLQNLSVQIVFTVYSSHIPYNQFLSDSLMAYKINE